MNHLCRCRCQLLVVAAPLVLLLLLLWAPMGVVDARLASSSSSRSNIQQAAGTLRQKSVVQHNEREVALAVELLRSIGAQQLCVPDTHTARRYTLPLCISSTTTTLKKEKKRNAGVSP